MRFAGFVLLSLTSASNRGFRSASALHRAASGAHDHKSRGPLVTKAGHPFSTLGLDLPEIYLGRPRAEPIAGYIELRS
jgi:hypothetical protein